MSLDFSLYLNGGGAEDHIIFSANITHNLGAMAEACGLYAILWQPEEGGYLYG